MATHRAPAEERPTRDRLHLELSGLLWPRWVLDHRSEQVLDQLRLVAGRRQIDHLLAFAD